MIRSVVGLLGKLEPRKKVSAAITDHCFSCWKLRLLDKRTAYSRNEKLFNQKLKKRVPADAKLNLVNSKRNTRWMQR
jgi:hypothetical protein